MNARLDCPKASTWLSCAAVAACVLLASCGGGGGSGTSTASTTASTFQRRAHEAKAARESVLVEMAGLRRRQALPLARILPSHVAAFSKVMRARLRDRASGFAKDYLRAVVDEIRVEGNAATISGSYERLIAAVANKKEGSVTVPSFMPEWRARQESNL